MPICKDCGMTISDKAVKMHPLFCAGRKPAAGPQVPPTKPDSTVNGGVPLSEPKGIVLAPVAQDNKAGTEVVSAATQSTVPSAGVTGVEASSVAASPTTTITATVTHTDNPAASANGSEVFFPISDPYFVVNDQVAELLRSCNERSKKHPTNMLITGQPGGGKTSLPLQFAAIYHRPCVVADFGIVQEPQQLFQTTRLVERDGKVITDTRESGFIRGIETPQCVVVMDELTRVENERCLNPLMPILDGRRNSWIDDLRRRVHVADGVMFVATINEGSMFCGISSLDSALRDRFTEVYMDYLPPEHEARVLQNKTGISDTIAATLAGFAAIVRRNPKLVRKVSTRQLLTAAETYTAGVPLWLAVESALGNYNDPQWRQDVMEIFSLNIRDEIENAKWQNKREANFRVYDK